MLNSVTQEKWFFLLCKTCCTIWFKYMSADLYQRGTRASKSKVGTKFGVWSVRGVMVQAPDWCRATTATKASASFITDYHCDVGIRTQIDGFASFPSWHDSRNFYFLFYCSQATNIIKVQQSHRVIECGWHRLTNYSTISGG